MVLLINFTLNLHKIDYNDKVVIILPYYPHIIAPQIILHAKISFLLNQPEVEIGKLAE